MVGDIIYFQKDESELSSKWTVGKVTEVTRSRDGLVRRATLMYQNANENKPRNTDRANRSLIKLFHIDDQDWQADMAEVEKIVSALKQDKEEASLPVYSMSYTGDGLRYRLDRLNATSTDRVVVVWWWWSETLPLHLLIVENNAVGFQKDIFCFVSVPRKISAYIHKVK